MNEELKITKASKDQPTSSSPLKQQRRKAKLPKWREGFTGYPSPPSSQQPTNITTPALTTSPGEKAAVKKSTTTTTTSHSPGNPSTSTAAAALPISPPKQAPSSAATTINPPTTTTTTAIASGSQHSHKIYKKKSTSKPPKDKKPSSSSSSVPIPTAAQKELKAQQRLERAKALQAAREAAIDKQAIKIMTRELHIPLNKAKEALDETKNEAKIISSSGGGEEVDLDTWVEAAQVWLALEQEVTDEHIQLGEAMEVSLAEAEQRRQKITPIEERAAEEIAAAFESSSTMKTLVDDCNMAVVSLFGEVGGEMKKFMIEWLTLEQNCKKWYAVSRYYFDMVAEEVKALYVNDSDGGNVAVCLLLGQKMDIVKHAVFTMPEVETTAGWVPQLFLDAARGKEEDVVEILD